MERKSNESRGEASPRKPSYDARTRPSTSCARLRLCLRARARQRSRRSAGGDYRPGCARFLPRLSRPVFYGSGGFFSFVMLPRPFNQQFLRLIFGWMEKNFTRLFGVAPGHRYLFGPGQLPRQIIVRVHASTVGAPSIGHCVSTSCSGMYSFLYESYTLAFAEGISSSLPVFIKCIAR